jgi:hypothetical protein
VDRSDLESDYGLRPNLIWMRPLLRAHPGQAAEGDGAGEVPNDGDPRTSGPGFGLTVHASALSLPYTWAGHRVVFVNSVSDLSGGVMILKFGSSQVSGHKCRLRAVRQVSRTGGAGR